jgi:hypothetical protein
MLRVSVTTPPFPIYMFHSMYRNNFSFFTCAIIMKPDYSSFTVDVLYPIMQQWPWWPIAATEGEEKETFLPLLPTSKL